MEEVENQSVIQEIATPETQTHAEASQEALAEVRKVEDQKVEDRQERNWRMMRKKQEDLEKELEIQRRLNERLLQATPTVEAPKEIDELDSIGDEEFLPKGKNRKLVARELEPLRKEVEDLKKQLRQKEEMQFMDNLKKKYPDFDEVVNQETMSLLEEQDPELAQTIADLKDPYKIGIQVYKYSKALNIHSKVSDARRSKEVDKKIESNSKTVQTPQAYDKRPMAQAFKLTDMEKSKLYEEMMGYASQAGFSY